MATKTESNPQAKQISEPDNNVITSRILTDHRLNQQEAVITGPPSGPVLEKVIPDNPENNPTVENSAQSPVTGIRTDIDKKKHLIKPMKPFI